MDPVPWGPTIPAATLARVVSGPNHQRRPCWVSDWHEDTNER